MSVLATCLYLSLAKVLHVNEKSRYLGLWAFFFFFWLRSTYDCYNYMSIFQLVIFCLKGKCNWKKSSGKKVLGACHWISKTSEGFDFSSFGKG